MTPSRQEWTKVLAARCGRKMQEKLSKATVAVCGLGGLGSNIALALARAGTGRLVLIDFDRVDVGNLHRQNYKASQVGAFKTDALAENLHECSPWTELELHTVRLTENNALQLLRGADIVCEAFDRAESKAMLANFVLEKLPDCFLVAASGMAGMGSPNAIQTKKVTSRFYLCGDLASDAADNALAAPRVLLCAAHQAQTALRIIAGEYDV